MLDETTAHRFWSRVDKRGPNECWPWIGTPTSNGYAQVIIAGRRFGVHRLAYETVVGPIPDGLQIDHLCRTKLCCNPRHLEPVTGRVNTLRCPDAPATKNAAKTHCPQGHPYEAPHLYVSKTGKRHCLTCIRNRKRVRRREAGIQERKRRQ